MYSFSTLISVVFVFIIAIWIRWRKQRFNMFQRNKIPGPKPNFIFGNFLEFHDNKIEALEQWIQMYGKIFGFFLGAKPYLFCADVELLKLCQIKDVKNFANKDWVLPDCGTAHKVAEHMLVLQKDKKWKKLRSALSYCFTSSKIKMMSTLMSDPINVFLKNIKGKNEQPFDISKLIQTLVFDIVCTSSFGVITNVQNNESNKFIKSAQAVFGVDSTDVLALLSICFPEIEPLPTLLRRLRDKVWHLMNKPSVTVVYDTCKNIINSRRKSEYNVRDLLQSIIDAEDESEGKKLPDDVIISNAILFMAAGYETTSVSLSWCMHFVAHHPEVQKQLREEINKNIDKDLEIKYSDVHYLRYMDQVISETLRFWPLTPLITNRVCEEDFQYQNITIPKGSIILIPIPVLHNDPNYWPEPHKFDPNRFSLDERREIDSLMYQPFGAGQRMCIGMRLAKTVMKLIIANLVRSFRLEPCEEKEKKIDNTLFINHPKNGVVIKAIPINS